MWIQKRKKRNQKIATEKIPTMAMAVVIPPAGAVQILK